MKKSLQLSMDLYYIGMILYQYGMKPYHICIESYGVKLYLTALESQYRLGRRDPLSGVGRQKKAKN